MRKCISEPEGVGKLFGLEFLFLFFQAEDGIRDRVASRGLGDVYKRQGISLRRMQKEQYLTT